MSARKDAYNTFLTFLREHSEFFNAPYGVIEGTIEGKHSGSVVAYTITFGQAATMDAHLKIFSDKKMELTCSGYYSRFTGIYRNVEELIEIFTTYL